ncbi:MAG: hypothetical protein NTY09_02265, partial [bacterium]|nr:hypothetical protein [bacterium]
MNIHRMMTMILLAVTVLITSVSSKATNYSQYSEEILCTIPWGDAPGQLSRLWNAQPDLPEWHGLIDPPHPWAMSSADNVVISDFDGKTSRLMKFTPDGQMVAYLDLGSLGLNLPFYLAVNKNGQV